MKHANIVFLSACSDARVVKDMTTGKSKGYGFVSFYNKLVRLQGRAHDEGYFSFLFFCILLYFIKRITFFKNSLHCDMSTIGMF